MTDHNTLKINGLPTQQQQEAMGEAYRKGSLEDDELLDVVASADDAAN